MSSDFFKVTGIDPNEDANVVFVWSRDRASNEPVLLGSGHVVRADTVRPSGIADGQYAITFILPENCIRAGIIVTGDAEGKQILPRINVTACSVPAGTEPRMIFSGATAARIAAEASASQSQPVLACNTE
jgi:hypothetical protein